MKLGDIELKSRWIRTLGAFLNDLPKFQRLPPIAPIANALPASSIILQGLGISSD